MSVPVLQPSKNVVRHLTASAVTACLAMLAACDPTGPDNPIPEQIYQANLNYANNTCQVPDDSLRSLSFSFLILPLQDGAQVLGVLAQPVPGARSGDVMTLNVPIPTDTFIVVFAATWTFSQNRESFQGPTTFEVKTAHDISLCIVTFNSSGSHFEEPSPPPSQLPPIPEGAAAAGDRVSTAVSTIAHQWSEGGQPTGDVAWTAAVGCSSLLGRTVSVSGLFVNNARETVPIGNMTSLEVRSAIYLWHYNTTSGWQLLTEFYPATAHPEANLRDLFNGGLNSRPSAWVPVQSVTFSPNVGGWFYVTAAFYWVDLANYAGRYNGIRGWRYIGFDGPSGYLSLTGDNTGVGGCLIP
jgi:hypothetical protein